MREPRRIAESHGPTRSCGMAEGWAVPTSQLSRNSHRSDATPLRLKAPFVLLSNATAPTRVRVLSEPLCQPPKTSRVTGARQRAPSQDSSLANVRQVDLRCVRVPQFNGPLILADRNRAALCDPSFPYTISGEPYLDHTERVCCSASS